ncbi:MAG TPA: Crp/Fnr family transcriptional regulator [Agriterribacter sp.]|nr:Crp/Fnr family transcriptional regulator [Agriterribacter sp.]
MQDSLIQLRNLVERVYPLPEPEWQAFAGIWQPFSAKRKEIITATGEREKYLYFVMEGLQRVYYLDEYDREATLVFTYAPSFGGVLDAMMLRQPSRYAYETLTPSVFLRTPYDEVERLMKENPAVETMIRKGLANVLSGLLERLVEIQCYSSEDKFKRLLQRSPHILQMIPHKYLASYLGIDATNFSKLINKVRI